MRRTIRFAFAALLTATALLPADAHAFAGFRFFTNRAAFLAALGNPPSTHQVDLNAIPTPGGSATVTSIDGGLIGVSTRNQDGGGTTSAPMVVDPVALALPGSFGTGKLLTFSVEDLDIFPSSSGTGRVQLDLPAGVTGAAFEYANIVTSGAINNRLASATQVDGSTLFNDFSTFTLPDPPTNGFAFLGVTVDPDATVPASQVAQLDALLSDEGGLAALYLRNIEYSFAPAVTATPEPTTVMLVAGGAVPLLGLARRRRRRV